MDCPSTVRCWKAWPATSSPGSIDGPLEPQRMLENINSPDDLKRLSLDELKELAREMRETVVRQVAAKGGHLASNLGTVDITVALHKVYDAPRDKIVWDTGHQAYPHKLVTGRFKEFHTLKQYGGLSGF